MTSTAPQLSRKSVPEPRVAEYAGAPHAAARGVSAAAPGTKPSAERGLSVCETPSQTDSIWTAAHWLVTRIFMCS